MTGKVTVIFPGFQGFPGAVGTLFMTQLKTKIDWCMMRYSDHGFFCGYIHIFAFYQAPHQPLHPFLLGMYDKVDILQKSRSFVFV